MESPSQPGEEKVAALAEAIDRLWQRFLPELRARVEILEGAAKAIAQKKLTAGQCVAAQAAAHKLAGVLGTFGLTRGTVIAHELELIFCREGAAGDEPGEQLTAATAELRTMIENRPPTS
jgi:HPt (histidine-containing phosphotransfer) domain-containing protein